MYALDNNGDGISLYQTVKDVPITEEKDDNSFSFDRRLPASKGYISSRTHSKRGDDRKVQCLFGCL
jgi:hypothetical protein